MTSETPLQQMLRALVRFWWVAIVGIVLAGLVFVFATYTVTLGVPPKLEARAKSTYTASTQLLITSKRDPYLSAANVNNKVITYPTAAPTTTDHDDGRRRRPRRPTATTTRGADGDLQRLVEIANSLPPRVTSDPVINLRNKRYGRIDGTRHGGQPLRLLGRRRLPLGPAARTSRSRARRNSPQDALDITNRTATRVQGLVRGAGRSRAKTKVNDRVLVEQVNSADRAFAQGGSKPLLGVAAALLVLLGAAGLRARTRAPDPAPLAPRAARRRGAGRASELARSSRPSEPALPALEVPTMTFGDAGRGGCARPREEEAGAAPAQAAPATARGTAAPPRTTTSTPARRALHRRRQLARARERLHRPPATRRPRARRAGARSRSRCPCSACWR